MELNGNQVVLKNKNYKKKNRVGKTKPMVGATEKAMDLRLSKFMSNGDISPLVLVKPHLRKNPNHIDTTSKADKEFQLKQDRMFWLEAKVNSPTLSKAMIKKYKKELMQLMEA